MTSKIIVADDSTTIQKVVRITLASEPVEIIECLTDDELVGKARSNDFDLLLLDFNLSESKSGYQLAADLRANGVTAPILAMLGTFDTIDETQLAQAGIDDRIIKPFESDIFIQKCRELVEKGRPEAAVETSPVEVEETSPASDLNIPESADWVVNSPDIDFGSDTAQHDVTTFDLDTPDNALDKELEGWGIDVPSVINSEESTEEFGEIPPVIESASDEFELQSIDSLEVSEPEEEEDFDIDATSAFDIKEFENTHEHTLPDSEDLEYPELSLDTPLETAEESSDDFDFGDMGDAPTSIDELAPEVEVEEPLALEEDIARSEELEKEFDLDDDEDGDIWAVDEELESESAPVAEESFEVEDLPELEVAAPVLDLDETKAPEAQVSAEEIVEKLMESITPLVEEMIKKHCHEAVERVAWEVIPDLAENLIKKEIKDISESL